MCIFHVAITDEDLIVTFRLIFIHFIAFKLSYIYRKSAYILRLRFSKPYIQSGLLEVLRSDDAAARWEAIWLFEYDTKSCDISGSATENSHLYLYSFTRTKLI